MELIRFDDEAALQQRVGEDFSPYGDPLLITQEMIDRFAELTGDKQWIHIDVERARRHSPFGTTVAHGFLLLSLLPRLRARQDWQVIGHGNALNYGADKLRFINPVPAGSTVHARARLLRVEKKAKGTLLTEEIEVAVAGADRPALSYVMLVLYQPTPPPQNP